MQITYFTIAGGNKTALVWDCPDDNKTELIDNLLTTVEQVGFVKNNTLTMMGGELCINALLALASHTESPEGVLEIDTKQRVSYTNHDGKTTIAITLPYTKIDNFVLFDGIGFMCTREKNDITSQMLAAYAEKYNVPAFGVLEYDDEARISPHVHVVGTHSTVHETACGSGSVAAHVVTGHNDIIQPTGESISVRSDGDTFYIEATVTTLL